MDAKTSGLVRSSADDRSVAFPSDDHGLTAQVRVVPLLDGRIEGIHINVDDFSHNRLAISAQSREINKRRRTARRCIENWSNGRSPQRSISTQDFAQLVETRRYR